ncbi:PRC-barrel domain-containing protein [Microvirga splendida]|uniref:PRC-barrel domain-containing protein n=1 Tax=Microvirga splendida TaxID=2795727 RepID=A0ABS0Y3X4_9HYPH|nr:PRC-barrel domain-containing protein [Microvirga splendida]MBJ6126991.1 hypothetical protein [Microvirga splendida]
MPTRVSLGLLLVAGCTALSSSWVHAQLNQEKTECDRLISVLQGKTPAEAHDALQKMQIHRQEGQYQACIAAAQAQGSQSSPGALKVEQAAGMDVFNEKGEQVGNVDRLARGSDQRVFVLMTYRGPRWPGNKQVAIPLDNMAMHAGRLLLPGIGEKDILAMPAVPEDGGTYRPLDQSATVTLRQLDASPSQTGTVR